MARENSRGEDYCANEAYKKTVIKTYDYGEPLEQNDTRFWFYDRYYNPLQGALNQINDWIDPTDEAGNPHPWTVEQVANLMVGSMRHVTETSTTIEYQAVRDESGALIGLPVKTTVTVVEWSEHFVNGQWSQYIPHSAYTPYSNVPSLPIYSRQNP